jgi:hypothetical protein
MRLIKPQLALRCRVNGLAVALRFFVTVTAGRANFVAQLARGKPQGAWVTAVAKEAR